MCYKIQKNIFSVHIRVLWSSFPLHWKPNILLVNYDSWWQHQMSVCELRHDRPSGRFSKSRGLSASVSFLSSPPPPRSFTYAIFERSLTIVPRSLLLNRTVTLATQARSYEDKNDTPSTLSKNHEDSQKPYSIGRYTQYLAHVWAATGTTVVSFSIFLNAINSSVGP